MMTRISSAMNQLIWLVSADFGTILPSAAFCRFGYPASNNTAFHLAASNPVTLVVPTDMSTDFDPGTLTILNERPDLVSKSCARSHCVKFDHGPTKIWKLQVD